MKQHTFKHEESKGTCTCTIKDENDPLWCDCGYCKRCGRSDFGGFRWPPMPKRIADFIYEKTPGLERVFRKEK